MFREHDILIALDTRPSDVEARQSTIGDWLGEAAFGVPEETEDLLPISPALDATFEQENNPIPEHGFDRDSMAETPAYKWLVTSLQREAKLTRAEPDLMEEIKREILDALPSSHKVSRNYSSREYKMQFTLGWNPIMFIQEQRYTEDPDIALETAITLTGSSNNAQALTTREYLTQTWPATGHHIMKLVNDVIRDIANHQASGESNVLDKPIN